MSHPVPDAASQPAPDMTSQTSFSRNKSAEKTDGQSESDDRMADRAIGRVVGLKGCRAEVLVSENDVEHSNSS